MSGCRHCGLPAHGAEFCCLGCRIAWQVAGAGGDEGQARWAHARFLLAALFAVAVMTQSMILYTEDVYAVAQHPALDALVRWSLLALGAPVFFLLAPALWPDHRPRTRRWWSLDLWILVAVGAAFGLSAVRVWRGSGALYFESACMVLVLVTLGRYLDARARTHVGRAAAQLRALVPETALRLADGQALATPVAELRAGDAVRLAAGERAAVDGAILAGRASCDFSLFTGENAPRALGPGEVLPAGVLVLDGALDVRVTAAGGARGIDRIAEALEQARAARTPAYRTADRLAAVLLPATLLLAASVFVWHAQAGAADVGLGRALAVLLVSCPCGLGLATPLATWAAIGRALQRGVLVRNPAVFETLPRIRSFLFDKTGTLTAGERRLRGVHAPGAQGAALEGVAQALAAASRHPAARALSRGRVAALPDQYQVLPGRGVRGRVGATDWWLGNRALLREQGAPLSADQAAAWQRAEDAGLSVLVLGSAAAAQALFLLEETPRPEAAEVLAQLRSGGARLLILSGDALAPTTALAQRLGVAARAELLPQDKEHAVAAAAAQVPTLYFGDGINDGPALARADVSATFGAATEVARAAADLVFLREDLRGLTSMQGLARRTRRQIRFNLFWSVFYNPVFLFLAATGRLTAVWCALAMAASSLLVTALSLRREPAAASVAEPAPWSFSPRLSHSAS
ncbi:MAG: cation-translocating P-type ATPase [Planctomycetota bacterium]|nr:MAG: cation-translocating P-type ATPase [Planctomycetota bacterium]